MQGNASYQSQSDFASRAVKLLLLFVLIYFSFWAAAFVLAYKFIQYGWIFTSAPVFLVPCAYAINDIVCEVYGYKVARLMVWYTLIALFIFSALIFVMLQLPNIEKFHTLNLAYSELYGPILRVYVANFIAIAAGAFVNSYALAKWKILLRGKHFFTRSIFATFFGELVFSIIVNLLVNYGKVEEYSLIKLIIFSYSLKALISLFYTVISAVLIPFIKIYTKLDVYDYSTNFNPFKLSTDDEPTD